MNFKIVSSNIRFDNPKDGIHDWQGRRKILANLINDFNPDLLGTQEGREPQLKDFNSLLNHLEVVDGHRDWIPERMYPSIFINPKNIQVSESGDIWLSETPYVAESKSFGSAFPRICTWIKGKFITQNFPFLFLNCHLDHVLEATRKEQILVLIKEGQKINNENLPIILSGDFNENPKGMVGEELSNNFPFLTDPWPLFQKEEKASHHKFDGNTEGGSRIDWILYDKQFEVHEHYFEIKEEGGIFPSDHFPLFSEFKIVKK